MKATGAALPPLTRRELLVASLASLVFVGILLSAAGHLGSLGIARGDDWSFIRVLQGVAETGRIELTGWVQMTFVGQAAVVLPWLIAGARPSIADLQIVTALMAAGTMVLAYVLARFALPRWWAAVAPMSLVVSAVFGSLSVSVMTDVPATFAILLSLVLASWWLRTSRVLGLALGLLAGLWAFSIREYGIVVVLAILGASWIARPASRRLIAFSGGIALAIAGSFYLWRSGLPGSTPSEYGVNGLLDYSVPTGYLVFLALGLGVFPAVVFASPRRVLASLTSRSAFVVWTLLVLGGLILIRTDFPLGNYITVYGAYPGSALGTTSVQLLSRFEIGILLAASVYGLWLGAILVVKQVTSDMRQRADSILLLLGLFAVGFVALTLVTVFFLPVTFDRYLIPVFPVLAVLIARAIVASEVQLSGVVSWLAIAGLAAVFVVNTRIVLFSDLVDGLRWEVAQQAVDAGEVAGDVDAGFDWVGYHYAGSSQWSEPLQGDRWWHGGFPGFQPCSEVVLTSESDDSFTINASRSVPFLPHVTAGLKPTGLCTD